LFFAYFNFYSCITFTCTGTVLLIINCKVIGVTVLKKQNQKKFRIFALQKTKTRFLLGLFVGSSIRDCESIVWLLPPDGLAGASAKNCR
jgi:hypothetical protein